MTENYKILVPPFFFFFFKLTNKERGGVQIQVPESKQKSAKPFSTLCDHVKPSTIMTEGSFQAEN